MDGGENPSTDGHGSRTEPVRKDPRKIGELFDFGDQLGQGSFGVVYLGRCKKTNARVAVKQVLQDPRYKNRELDIMRVLNHPNIVRLRDYFFTELPDGGINLNLVMDYVPITAYRVARNYSAAKQRVPKLIVKLFIYQLCRAIGYLHGLEICHRDIKPQNLLVDDVNYSLKLCDFGSAKKLKPDESSIAYICSRFYRAPELMLGTTQYTTAIDVWSIGCVMGELILGAPLFPGCTSVDQLVKIIQNLGTPTPEEMVAMNPCYTDFRFPDVKGRSWSEIMGPSCCGDTLDLISRLLQYDPRKRIKPIDAMAHAYFDELRDSNTKLPNGKAIPELFDFTAEEVGAMSESTAAVLLRPRSRPNSLQSSVSTKCTNSTKADGPVGTSVCQQRNNDVVREMKVHEPEIQPM